TALTGSGRVPCRRNWKRPLARQCLFSRRGAVAPTPSRIPSGGSGAPTRWTLVSPSTGQELLASSFHEKLYNRGPRRTTSVAAAAPPRHRAFLTAAPAAGAPSDARS